MPGTFTLKRNYLNSADWLQDNFTLNIEGNISFAPIDPFDLDLHTPKLIGIFPYIWRYLVVSSYFLALKLRPVERGQTHTQTHTHTQTKISTTTSPHFLLKRKCGDNKLEKQTDIWSLAMIKIWKSSHPAFYITKTVTYICFHFSLSFMLLWQYVMLSLEKDWVSFKKITRDQIPW